MADRRVGLVLVTFYAGERASALLRHVRFESRRAKSQYPLNDNDPVNRSVV